MTTNTFPNRFAAPCSLCGQRIPEGQGVTRKGHGNEPKWVTSHAAGSCPTEGAEAPVQPSASNLEFTPTPEQMECVKWFATHGDLVIQAGAGAGKTSTLRLLAQHALANGRRGWYGAFNKGIVVDTAGKMSGNVECSTMHSLAMGAVGNRFRHRLDSNRQRNDEVGRLLGVDSLSITVGEKSRTLAAGFLAGKVMAAVKRFCRSADPAVSRSHFEYIEGIDLPDEAGNRTYENNDLLADYLLPYAVRAWADLTDEAGRLRYSHDCYLKLWSLNDPRIDKDFILFDEAQDADPVQVAIIENFKRHGVQIVVVGDEQQVIYDWRGAVDALARFEAMGAHVCFLSQSFRFGNAIADVANGLLGRLDARLRIRGFGDASRVAPVAEPDAILCRSNAGAVKQLFAQLAAGRRAALVGKGDDVLSFCRAARDLQMDRSTTHPELCIFDSWVAVQEYVTNDEQGEDLKLMVKLVDDFGADRIILAVETMVAERDADVVISTAHKSKGREWNSVQIGADFRAPEAGRDLSPSELRLAYVAATRAKRELDLTNVPHFLGLAR